MKSGECLWRETCLHLQRYLKAEERAGKYIKKLKFRDVNLIYLENNVAIQWEGKISKTSRNEFEQQFSFYYADESLEELHWFLRVANYTFLTRECDSYWYICIKLSFISENRDCCCRSTGGLKSGDGCAPICKLNWTSI